MRRAARSAPRWRGAAAPGLLLLAACSTLHDSGGCPKPCPPSCPSSCLPTGYCSEVVRAVPDSPPTLVGGGIPWSVIAGDLPPGAALEMSLHAALDLADRHDASPWSYRIELYDPDLGRVDPVLLVSSPNSPFFPIEADYSRSGKTDGTGAFSWRGTFHCIGRSGLTDCILRPGSAITVRLLDPSPWSVAPACH